MTSIEFKKHIKTLLFLKRTIDKIGGTAPLKIESTSKKLIKLENEIDEFLEVLVGGCFKDVVLQVAEHKIK